MEEQADLCGGGILTSLDRVKICWIRAGYLKIFIEKWVAGLLLCFGGIR